MAASVAEGDGNASHTSLAAEVLQISNLLAQQASDKDGGSYKFSMNDLADGGSDESFELNRDDALQLIGLCAQLQRVRSSTTRAEFPDFAHGPPCGGRNGPPALWCVAAKEPGTHTARK
eukprot:g15734.t1